MALTDKQRDLMLTRMAQDIRALRKHLIPETERGAITTKRDRVVEVEEDDDYAL